TYTSLFFHCTVMRAMSSCVWICVRVLRVEAAGDVETLALVHALADRIVLLKRLFLQVVVFVGADVVKKAGGVVKTIDFVPGYSTTRIVEKIKRTINN
ncbi:MAG: hypothetical protein ACK5YT_08225, partial [Bacteroidota bacterium]